MSANIKVSGTWREASGIWVKVSGTWQDIQQGWIKVGGTFQQFFGSILYVQSRTITRTGVIVKGSGAAEAGIVFETDGTFSTSGYGIESTSPAYDGDEYVNGGDPTDYHVRVTATGDTGDMGGLSLSTWYSLGSVSREWNIDISGGGASSNSVDVTFEFSDDGGSTVLETFTDILTLTAGIS